MSPPVPLSLTAELRSLPRAYWVLFLGTFINRFGTFVYPFLTIFLKAQGRTLGEIGVAVGAHGGGSLIASLLGGQFADRFGRRNTIVVGTWANALFVLGLYYAPNFPMIVLLSGLAGLSGGFYHPASSALVADIVPESLRLRAYAGLRLALNAGFAAGAAAAGFLVHRSTFWLFAGDAITTASYGLLALVALPHGVRTMSREASWLEAVARIRRDGQFWMLFTCTLMAALIFAQFSTTYSMEITNRGLAGSIFGWKLTPEEVYGFLIGWNGVMVMCFELVLTRFTQRFDQRLVMALGYGLLGLGFALNGFASAVTGFFLGMTVFTVGEMLAFPMSSAYIARIAPENMRGRYIGALGMAWSASGIVGPQLGFWVVARNSFALWIGCGVLGLIAAFTMLRFGDGRRVAESIGQSTESGPPVP